MKSIHGCDIIPPEPTLEELDMLCASHPRVDRIDLYHCWKNASRYWLGIDPAKLNPEHPLLRASRMLFVEAMQTEFPEDRANMRYAEALLIEPCTLISTGKQLAIAAVRVRTA